MASTVKLVIDIAYEVPGQSKYTFQWIEYRKNIYLWDKTGEKKPYQDKLSIGYD